jgi:tight adherence protein C
MDGFFMVVLIAAVVAFFIGVVMVVANLAGAGGARGGVSRGLEAIDTVYRSGRRVAREARGGQAPNTMTKLGRAATSGRSLARLRRWLDYAGNPPYWTVDRVFEIKGLSLIVAGSVGVVAGLALGGGIGGLIGGVIAAAVGFYVPDVVVYDLGDRRQEKIRLTLPDILDTLTVSVEAGLGFDAALSQISRYARGPLGGEIARVLQEMQIGRSRVDALRALGKRTNVVELRSFCAIVVQATELGVPIANVLREQSREMRIRRRQHAEELAQKVPIKILFPLIFCLFPALFIVVLGPGLINILGIFAK